MENFHSNFEWLDRLMPEGIPIPSSTVISGPGGSGKPLIGLAVVASWLRQGGKVVLVPLQYPAHAHARTCGTRRRIADRRRSPDLSFAEGLLTEAKMARSGDLRPADRETFAHRGRWR